MRQRLTLSILIILALSACSRQGGLEDPLRAGLWAEQQASAAEMSEWNLYARAALRLQGEAYHVNFQWQRQADDHLRQPEGPIVEARGHTPQRQQQEVDEPESQPRPAR